MDQSDKCVDGISETKDSFGFPKIKKQLATRAKRLEQFFWQEFFDEYCRQNDRQNDIVIPKSITEYFDEYCKDKAPKNEEREEALANKYPLYCTTPITFYNQSGDITKTFRKKYTITRPLQECTEPFGE